MKPACKFKLVIQLIAEDGVHDLRSVIPCSLPQDHDREEIIEHSFSFSWPRSKKDGDILTIGVVE